MTRWFTWVRHLHAYTQENRCLTLLVLLVGALTLEPFSYGYPLLEMMFLIITFLLFLLGPFLVTRSATVLTASFIWLMLVLAARAIVRHTSTALYGEILMVGLALNLYIIGYLVVYLVKAPVTNRDHIFGSLFTYFLVGLFFAEAYSALHGMDPASFNITNLEPGSQLATLDLFIYYSLSCLTTAGFGDILPVSPMARRLSVLEACIGVLYVAVFLAHIMGQHHARREHTGSLDTRPPVQ